MQNSMQAWQDSIQYQRIWTTWLLRTFWMILNVWLFVIMGLELHYHALGSTSTSLAVVVVIIFCVALNLGEMVAFAKNNLHPIFYLSCQVVKTAIWIGFSVFSIIGTVALRNLWLVDGNSGQYIEEGLPSVGIAVPVITLSVLLSFCPRSAARMHTVADKNPLDNRVLSIFPLIYASMVEHRWRRYSTGRERVGSQAEASLQVIGNRDYGLSPHGEILSPGLNHNEFIARPSLNPMESFARVGRADGLHGGFVPVKTARPLPGEDAILEPAPAYTPRASIGRELVVRDAGGPYELPDRRSRPSSVRSQRSNVF